MVIGVVTAGIRRLPLCFAKAEQALAKLIGGGYAFQLSGSEYVFDTSSDSLSKLAVAYNTALAYKAMGIDYEQAMVMQDYRVITMTRDDIIAKYEAMIEYGRNLYSTHASTIDTLGKMDYYALQDWYDTH